MKKFLVYLFCAVMFTTALSAEKPEFTLDLDDDYVCFYEESSFKRASEITGLDEQGIEELFDEEDLVMLALSSDNKRQIRVANYDNELSEKIGSFKERSYKDVRELADGMLDSFATGGTYSAKDVIENTEADVNKYMVYKELHTDSGGDYNVTQYITVVDGEFWHITTYAPNHSDIPDPMRSFRVNDDAHIQPSKIFYAVSGLFAVLAVAMLAVYLYQRRMNKTE